MSQKPCFKVSSISLWCDLQVHFVFVCYRAVTDSINMLLNACMSAAPGQKECDNALRNIQVWTPFVISY